MEKNVCLAIDFDRRIIKKTHCGEERIFDVYKSGRGIEEQIAFKRMYRFYFMLLGISAIPVDAETNATDVVPFFRNNSEKRIYDNVSQVKGWLVQTDVCQDIIEFGRSTNPGNRITLTRLVDFSIETVQPLEELNSRHPFSAFHNIEEILPRNKLT